MTPGTKLGSYEILAQIGAGGMGEVYRARDTKLGRDVAMKVLPEAFARDAERMARFQREAKVLASLNHTNITTIYGLEDSGSTRALVMELVEGPTLADRIKAGPIPVDEAIRIARQIADALEYAHERGIIHRDLKPANVKVTNDDAVKVLDFGLAKALEGDPSSFDISTSPTISQMATMQGVLLGTAAYMSPEQAKGKPVDRRADIWAFGCVLCEMLTGKMASSGETVTDTLAAVVMKDPGWSQLPAATPMRLRVLSQRCLQKDVRQRLQAMGDARISLRKRVERRMFIAFPFRKRPTPVPVFGRFPFSVVPVVAGVAPDRLRFRATSFRSPIAGRKPNSLT
jgi:serine/threonine-protein kinase